MTRRIVAYRDGLNLTPVPSPSGEGRLRASATPSPLVIDGRGVVVSESLVKEKEA